MVLISSRITRGYNVITIMESIISDDHHSGQPNWGKSSLPLKENGGEGKLVMKTGNENWCTQTEFPFWFPAGERCNGAFHSTTAFTWGLKGGGFSQPYGNARDELMHGVHEATGGMKALIGMWSE